MPEIILNETPENEKHKATNLRFAGPIKIIVVDPKSEYCKSVWCAIGITVANIAIGAVLMCVLHYSIVSGDAHAIIFCFAFSFFLAQAILAFNYANGWSNPLRIRHKRISHVFLHLCGIVLAITGTVIVTLGKGISASAHGITGISTTKSIITFVLFFISALFGPFALRKKNIGRIVCHMSLGIITFTMSSLCLCFGLFFDRFKNWAGDSILFILIFLISYYSVIILVGSFIKCMSRM